MAKPKKVPTGWQIRYRTPEGDSRRETYRLYVEAEDRLTKVKASQLDDSFVDRNAGKVKFAEWADQWFAAQTFDTATRAAVGSRLANHILPTFENMELRKVRPSTVQAWLRGRSDVLAPGTAKQVLSILNAIFGAAVEDGLLVKNPCSSRSVSAPAGDPARVIPWTVAELQAVIDAHPPEWRAVPIVGAGTGLRQGELFGLQVDDVDFLRRRLLVRHQAKRGTLAAPKGRKTREVPLPDVIGVAISEHLRTTGRPKAGPVFRRGGDLVDAQIFNRTIWKPALIEAEIEPSRRNGMHMLRHTYASMQLEAGTSIRALAEYLGHSDPGFTLRTYTHLMPASEDRARVAIDQALGRVDVGDAANG